MACLVNTKISSITDHWHPFLRANLPCLVVKSLALDRWRYKSSHHLTRGYYPLPFRGSSGSLWNPSTVILVVFIILSQRFQNSKLCISSSKAHHCVASFSSPVTDAIEALISLLRDMAAMSVGSGRGPIAGGRLFL